MTKLYVNTFLSLDGVMQAPGGPEEDIDGGFPFGGWTFPYWDEQMMETMGNTTSQPFAMVLGRRTYDVMAAHWPHASEEEGGPVFNNATKYMASHTPHDLTWENSVQLEGDVVEALRALKKQNGPELMVNGSWNLLQTLLQQEGLVDGFRLWIFPVVLGQGKKLFADGIVPGNLKLIEQSVSSTGVFMGTYEFDGPVPTGSFAHDQDDQG